MSSTTLARRTNLPDASTAFPNQLRAWRQKRRLSQLELSLVSGVSQRHLSFLESGRARPSREMVLQLCEALDVPLRDRNDVLTAAGFAALFSARSLDDPHMAQVLAAIRRMLDAHEPFPAVAVDRAWNVTLSNRAFDLFVAALGEDIWDRTGCSQRNLLRLTFHPQGIRPWVSNWSTVGPLLWQRACRESQAVGGEAMAAVVEELREAQDADTLRCGDDAPLLPVLPLLLERDGLRLSLFSVISTFGTAQDATADETRIESFLPSDAETEAVFRSFAG